MKNNINLDPTIIKYNPQLKEKSLITLQNCGNVVFVVRKVLKTTIWVQNAMPRNSHSIGYDIAKRISKKRITGIFNLE